MNSDNDPLCCCEYFDRNSTRNHILACCCNCQDLDESFDSIISGKGISEKNCIGLKATLQDRCRTPWIGGAQKVMPSTILPPIIIFAFLLLASVNLLLSVISACSMLVFLIYIRRRLSDKSKFFYKWTISSFVIQYIVFEYVVINLLEILWEENVALGILITISALCFWKVKSESEHTSNIFHMQAPYKSEYVLWLDCCVDLHNKNYYLLGLISLLGALIYSANLTLTSICLPYTIHGMILIPIDCSDVYDLLELRISFMSAVYSLLFAAYILFLIIRFSVMIMLRSCLRSVKFYNSL